MTGELNEYLSEVDKMAKKELMKLLNQWRKMIIFQYITMERWIDSNGLD